MSRQNKCKKTHFQPEYSHHFHYSNYFQHQNTAYKVQGFTLIELLLALGLMAILALLAYRGLDSVLRLHQGAYTHQQQAQAIDRTLTQLEADARQANSVTLLAPANTTISGVSNTGLRLQIKRRIENEPVILEWSLENNHLLRRANSENNVTDVTVNTTASIISNTSSVSAVKTAKPIQTADLLESIDTIEWLEWNIEKSTWNVVDLTRMQIQAQPNKQFPLINGLGLRLTIAGKTLEKHFLIGR
jgi:prepilin-type N-terminal cleavage/methylation domain-containing protein